MAKEWKVSDGIEEKIDVMEEKTDAIEEETNGEKLIIVRVTDVIEIISAIFNIFFSNRTIALRWLFLCYAQYLFY